LSASVRSAPLLGVATGTSALRVDAKAFGLTSSRSPVVRVRITPEERDALAAAVGVGPPISLAAQVVAVSATNDGAITVEDRDALAAAVGVGLPISLAAQVVAVSATNDGAITVEDRIVIEVLGADHSSSSQDPAQSTSTTLIESPTPREREVLALIAEGMSNRAIAERLGLSDHTVKFHVGSLLGKLDAATRAELVAIAARHGLIMV
jgi:two-component system, NarL family, nitrate/nitrite response regulator NarL